MAMRHGRLLFAAIIVALLGRSQDVQAQDAAEVVWAQLEAVQGWASGEGFLTRNYIIGKLAEDDTDSWTMTFSGGNDYVIIGACDGDCGDLDITVYDEDDNVVARDTQTDDVPVVELDLEDEGRYRIQMAMYQCSVEPCYFGLGIFYK